MNLDLFVQKTSNLSAENRLLKFAVMVIAGAILVSGVLISSAFNKKTVILVPPGLDQKVEISGDQVDKAYLKYFARYICDLALSYHPQQARSQFSELLSYYDTSKYAEGKKALYQTADQIEASETSSFFLPEKLNVDTGTRVIKVTGTRRLQVRDIVAEEGVKSFLINFTVHNGKVFIASILEDSQAESINTKLAVEKKQAEKEKNQPAPKQ